MRLRGPAQRERGQIARDGAARGPAGNQAVGPRRSRPGGRLRIAAHGTPVVWRRDGPRLSADNDGGLGQGQAGPDMPPTTLKTASRPHRDAMLSDGELVRRILSCHDGHVHDLSAAVGLAARIERRGGGPLPAGLLAHLERMWTAVVRHQSAEEAFLPRLAGGGVGVASLAALRAEHEAAKDDLERLVRLTSDYTAPPEGDPELRALYGLCRHYDQDFREHVRLEERILFPRLQGGRPAG